MIIDILDIKYKIGCKKGVPLDEPTAFEKLEAIIEWNKCSWPPDTTQPKIVSKEELPEDITNELPPELLQGSSPEQLEVLKRFMAGIIGRDDFKVIEEGGKLYIQTEKYPPNTKFLGDPPKLSPGNCFLFRGQTIAIDEDPKTKKPFLVLMISETGPLALERIYKDYIDPEYSLTKAETTFKLNVISHKYIGPRDCYPILESDVDDFRVIEGGEEKSGNILDNLWGFHKIPRGIWRALKDRLFIPGKKDKILEIVSNPCFEEFTFWIDSKGRLVYSLGDYSEDEFEIILPCIYPGLLGLVKE